MSTAEAASVSMSDRVIVALDVDSAERAREIVAQLEGKVGAFKIGLQLFTACGPDLVWELASAGHRIFLDLKYHDIPNTVAHAAVEAAKLGVWMLNVHAAGGSVMMKTAADAVRNYCTEEGIRCPLLIGVTVLTSSTDEVLSETGVNSASEEQVLRLARLVRASGMDGVVASAREAELLRQQMGPEFMIVTPGIRSADATSDDQRRVTTFEQAIAAGSDYAVIGRPITLAEDMSEAVDAIVSGK